MMTIFPDLSISIRAICTPAAVTALTALVTSCCRNVEGARDILVPVPCPHPQQVALRFLRYAKRCHRCRRDMPLDDLPNHRAQFARRQGIKLNAIALEFIGVPVAFSFGRAGGRGSIAA